MNYSDLVNSVRGVACILSLRKSPDKSSGEITIAAANRDYLASVNRLDEEFVPNRPYTYYVARDTNFEALAAGCITAGTISHQYVNADLYEAWLDIYMIPLEKDEEGNGLKTANDTKGHNEGEPSFALGAHYDDAEMNIKKTMRIADSNMYENKAEYYGSHPNADRRTH